MPLSISQIKYSVGLKLISLFTPPICAFVRREYAGAHYRWETAFTVYECHFVYGRFLLWVFLLKC